MATSQQKSGTEATDAPEHGQHAEPGHETHTGSRTVGMGMNATLPPLPGIGPIEPKRLLWWGGLAAAGALGVIEWPVAAAVGVGSYVAERFAREDQRQGAATR